MFIELFSQDVVINGDGAQNEAKFNVVGWPFNMDLSEHAEAKVSAYQVTLVDSLETLTQLECEQDGSFITITFPDVLQGGESATVRLRAKVQV